MSRQTPAFRNRMSTMKITPASRISGEVILPGDKSISHRAAILLALSDGKATITNFATSADCGATVDCLRALGVEIEREPNALRVNGVGKEGLKRPDGPLNCDNSGTTMRLMSGVLAGQDFESVLIGDESLQKRPMKRVIDPIVRMGAKATATNGHSPLTIHGRRPLKAIDLEPSVASAQLKSCVLLAGLNAEGETSVLESTPTRDHTERMLRWLGADVCENKTPEGTRISVSGNSRLAARDIAVPADLSSAAFFMVAAGFLNGSSIKLPGVGINSSRRAIADTLIGMGVDMDISNVREASGEPVADILVRGKPNFGNASSKKLSGSVIANLIDEIPILAVAGTQIDEGLEIRDASELRIKESDRISAIVENLRRMGAGVEEFDDGLRVDRSDLKGAVIDPFGDHRIAMAFAVAGLFADGETEIVGSECAAVSFPAFYDELARVIY